MYFCCCFSYFYKESLQLDSNTLNTKDSLSFIHKHLLCTNNIQGTGDTKMNKNWSLLLRILLSTGGNQIHQ